MAGLRPAPRRWCSIGHAPSLRQQRTRLRRGEQIARLASWKNVAAVEQVVDIVMRGHDTGGTARGSIFGRPGVGWCMVREDEPAAQHAVAGVEDAGLPW